MKTQLFVLCSITFILFLFSCTRDESPAPLPPPVKPVVVVEEVNRQRQERSPQIARHQNLIKEVKEKGYVVATASGSLSCDSVCQKVGNCLKERASSMLARYCRERCSAFPEDLISSFSGLSDCGKIAYNYNRFNCDYACGLASRSSNQKIQNEIGKDRDRCIGECMASIGTAENGMRMVDCFIGKNSSEELEECVRYLGEVEPKGVEDLMR